MRALLSLMVVLLLVLGALFYLFGNPLEMLAEPPAQTDVLREGTTTEAAPLVVANGPVLDATPPAPASEPVRVEAEARQFLETLTEPAVEPVAVGQADHFVRADQEISMVPTSAIETTTLEELKQDKELTPNTPITVVRTVEQIEATTPQRVIAESEGNLDATIRVLGEDRQVRETTVREVLEQQRQEPSAPIMVVREVEHYEVTTIAELEAEMTREQAALTPLPTPASAATTTAGAASGATSASASTGGVSGTASTTAATGGEAGGTVIAQTGASVIAQSGSGVSAPAAQPAMPAALVDPLKRTIRIIREPYTVSRATVAEILESRNETVEPDSVFYVRTVRANDGHGIWGIVQDGIIENFARGVALRRGEEINTFQVEIPRDADELEQDRSSSFLGRMIYDKSRESHVYNYRLNRMGQSPDRIYPGQELVIIQFHADELVSIYRHFVEQQG